MRVCIADHYNPSFGDIPAGSLWDDESPYVDDDNFADVNDVADDNFADVDDVADDEEAD